MRVTSFAVGVPAPYFSLGQDSGVTLTSTKMRRVTAVIPANSQFDTQDVPDMVQQTRRMY